MQTVEIEKLENIYSVTRLTKEVRLVLEEAFPFVWVEGEISNFSAPTSGHWYFALKDEKTQVRCAMFRGNQRKLDFVPKDGMHILVKARISLYEVRGEFQLIIDNMEERGEGKLQRAFLLLKKKLEEAGLFSSHHKKPLPSFPKQIGVITSATGAAVRDILHVLKRRYPLSSVIIYHTLVQGESAAGTIVNAVETANRRNECDVLIIARGGGSLEDLWPFNEEVVAHAIFKSEIPIVSGVGHEIDFTIADFVADVRAPTPSAAAEMVTPDRVDILQSFAKQIQRFNNSINQRFISAKEKLGWIRKHLSQQHPRKRLNENMQRLDFDQQKLVQLHMKFMNQLQSKLKIIDAKLERYIPTHKIYHLKNQINHDQQQLQHYMIKCLTNQHHQLSRAAAKLDTLSPLATLKRGYAIARHEEKILQDIDEVAIGDEINVRLLRGVLLCSVNKKLSS